MRRSLITLTFVITKEEEAAGGSGSFLVSRETKEPGLVVEVVEGGDITKQGHKSLKSVLSVSSQGHADLRERLTSLGLPEPGSKARGARSDEGDTGQDGEREEEEWEVSIQAAGSFTHRDLTLD